MRFEARELRPYAAPVTAQELQHGTTYFVVTFADGDSLVPEMKAVVFAGTDLASESEGQIYFQDYESYKRGVRYSTAGIDDGAEFNVCLPADLGFVFDYEHALDVLMVCSLRRRGLHTE